MNDNSTDSPVLVTMLKNFIEPVIHFLDADCKDPIVKAIGCMTAAGVELDRIKDAPEETIRSFFDSWILQSNAKSLTKLLRSYECYREVVLLTDPKLLTREFLALRDSIDEDKLGAILKSVVDSMDIENLRVLLSDKSGESGVEIKRIKKCQKQVKWMKSVIIFKTLTLLDALDCNVEDLARFIGLKDNIQIIFFFILGQCQQEKLIDYYYSLLEEQLYTAIAVQDTRARAAKFIQRVTGLYVILVIDKVVSYLRLKDLRFFALPMDPEI